MKVAGHILFITFQCFSFLYVNIGWLRENLTYAEPIFFSVASISGIYTLISKPVNSTIQISLFDIVFLLVISYLVFTNLLSGRNDLTAIAYITALGCSYFYFKRFVTAIKEEVLIKIITILLLVLFTVYVALFIAGQYSDSNVLHSFYFPNRSIFAILLASQLAFVLPLIFYSNKPQPVLWLKKIKITLIVLSSLCFVLLLLTKGRAGWLGFSASLLVIVYLFIKKRTHKVLFKRLSVLLLIGIFTVAFFYKSDSSKGRLLVYKTTLPMVKSNWITGIGYGQFKFQYNQYQAGYFKKNNIDSDEALLADNTYFAFNDYLQLLSEGGIIGLSLFSILVFLFFKTIKHNFQYKVNTILRLAALSSISTIIIAALFSYPFEIIPISTLLLFCIAIINANSSHLSFSIRVPKPISASVNIFLMSIGLLLLFYSVFLIKYKAAGQDALELSNLGFRNKALDKYKLLNDSYIKDGNTMYLYAKELVSSNRLTEAKQVIAEAKKYCSHIDLYKLSGAVEYELKNYEKAENEYLLAIRMVPNRLASRYDLFNFYLETNQKDKAFSLAKSIASMKIKVPSERATNMKESVVRKLEEFIGH